MCLVALSRGKPGVRQGRQAAPRSSSSSPAPVLPALLLPWRGRGRQLPRSGPSSATQRPVSMAAARARAQRRARPRRHRATAAEEQVPHLGTGTVGASRRPRLRRSRHSASACTSGRGGLRAVPLREGDAGLRLCSVSVCPAHWAWLLLPHGSAMRPSAPGCWETGLGGRLPETQWSCTRPGVVSNPLSRPASLPLQHRIGEPERVIPVVSDPSGPSSQVKPAQMPGSGFLQGYTTKAAHTPGTGNKGQREPTPCRAW